MFDVGLEFEFRIRINLLRDRPKKSSGSSSKAYNH